MAKSLIPSITGFRIANEGYYFDLDNGNEIFISADEVFESLSRGDNNKDSDQNINKRLIYKRINDVNNEIKEIKKGIDTILSEMTALKTQLTPITIPVTTPNPYIPSPYEFTCKSDQK